MDFVEWLRLRAPVSAEEYSRYYARYRGLLEALRFGELPCNSWLLKLAGSYLEYLLFQGSVGFQEYAAKRVELRLRASNCQRTRRGRGVYRCPERLPGLRGPVYWVWTGLLESGVRARHLWKILHARPEEIDGVLVWNIREVLGTKRINVIVLDPDTASRLYIVLREYEYRRVKDQAAKRKAPLSCARKIHWNACLAVTRDRKLCGFIQGRWAPVDIIHYEEYAAEAAKLSRRVWRYARLALEGYSIRDILQLVDDLEYYPPPNRVEPGKQYVPGLQAEGTGETGGDVHADIVSILSLYSDRLG